MARQLEDINSSGELAEILLGNTTEGDKLLKSSEVDTKISDSVAAPIDSKILTPQAGVMPDTEGLVFYDDNSKALSYKTDIPDVTLAVCHEQVIRVVNTSGATIPNGTPVRMTGVSGGHPTIGPAQATGFNAAWVLGVTTHEILDTAEGLITTDGELSMDTTAFSAGDVLYLSDSVAGGYTTTVPDISTLVGLVISADKLLVSIHNLLTLQTILGHLQKTGGTFALNAVFQNIDNYTSSQEVVMVPDITTGIIPVVIPADRAGTYRATFAASFTMTSTSQTREIEFKIFNITTGAEFIFFVSIARDVTGGSAAFSTMLNAAPSDEFVMQVASVDNINITFTEVSFSIESVHI